MSCARKSGVSPPLLRSRVALRQKRAKTGQIDAKATIRANLKHGSVPIVIKHRDRTLKPKLVVICDISTSMRPVSELMLSLIYALQDQISKTHAFAFIDRLEYVSPDFQAKEAREAVGDVLLRMPSGYYNTDLGGSLAEFSHDYLDMVDSRTTFIIVGDGRNNYNDPAAGPVQHRLRGAAAQTLWLNPEPPALWTHGRQRHAEVCAVLRHGHAGDHLVGARRRRLTSCSCRIRVSEACCFLRRPPHTGSRRLFVTG